MKKHTKQQKSTTNKKNLNFVAKHAHYFNKAVIFKDKSKYQRIAKHKNLEPFFMQCMMHYIKKGSRFFSKHRALCQLHFTR